MRKCRIFIENQQTKSLPGTNKNSRQWSYWTTVIAFVVCVVIAFTHHVKRGGPPITTWDVYGYWAYLPAVFTYSDTRTFSFVEEHFDDYEVASQIFQVTETNNGRIPVYTNGLAMIWTPGYLVAQYIAGLTGYERDGMSAPYQVSIILSCLLFGFIGLLVLRQFLLRYFPDKAVAIAIVLVVFGTNFYHYYCHSPGMPHAYLFTCHALLLYWTDSWFRSPKGKYVIGIAIVGALSCLIRPTEILMALVPIGFAISNRSDFSWSGEYLKQFVAGLFCAFAVIAPQVLLWKVNTDSWIFNAYADAGHEFHFDGRYLYDGLFSYRKGWFVYTPAMMLAVIGLYFLKDSGRRWRLPVLLILLGYVFVTFSWHWWWYANSFGARAMIHIYPELTLGLCAFMTYSLHRETSSVGLRVVPVLALVSVLVTLNIFQTWQYNNKVLPGDAINKYYFWRAFGRTEVPREELKYLFITPMSGKSNCEIRGYAEEFYSRQQGDSSTMVVSWESKEALKMTSGIPYSKAVELHLDESMVKELSGRWINVGSQLWLDGNTFNSMNNALHSIEIRRGDEVLMWQGLNFQVYLPQDQWVTDSWEYRLPEDLQPGDVFKYFIWNRSSPDTIYINRLSIGIYDCD